MTAKAYEVEWKLNKNTAVPRSQSPVACVENGTVDQVRFVPLAVEVGRNPSYGNIIIISGKINDDKFFKFCFLFFSYYIIVTMITNM